MPFSYKNVKCDEHKFDSSLMEIVLCICKSRERKPDPH